MLWLASKVSISSIEAKRDNLHVDCEKSQERGAKKRASSWQLSLSFPALAHEWFLYIYSKSRLLGIETFKSLSLWKMVESSYFTSRGTCVLFCYRIYWINWCLLNFWTLRVGAYSRWELIRGWALIKFSAFSSSVICLFFNKTINYKW